MVDTKFWSVKKKTPGFFPSIGCSFLQLIHINFAGDTHQLLGLYFYCFSDAMQVKLLTTSVPKRNNLFWVWRQCFEFSSKSENLVLQKQKVL
jgi:hypothetical protein